MLGEHKNKMAFGRRTVEATIRSVAILDLRAHDILIFYSDESIPPDIRIDIGNEIQVILDKAGIGNEKIILTHGMKLSILRNRT
jgi:hypothetical protein